MATTAVMNSTRMAMYVGGTIVGESTDASLSITMEPRDVSNKTSEGWRELLEGRRSWSGSASGMYIPNDSNYNFDDIFSTYVNRDQVTIRIASSEAGDVYYEGSAYITSANLNSPDSEDNVTFDISFEGTGVLSTGATT